MIGHCGRGRFTQRSGRGEREQERRAARRQQTHFHVETRTDDERVLAIMTGAGPSRPYICKACTAYALEQSLPVVGRSLS